MILEKYSSFEILIFFIMLCLESFQQVLRYFRSFTRLRLSFSQTSYLSCLAEMNINKTNQVATPTPQK